MGDGSKQVAAVWPTYFCDFGSTTDALRSLLSLHAAWCILRCRPGKNHDVVQVVHQRSFMAQVKETKLYSFPAAPTELATQITKRLQNILQSPITMRYDITYKLYRRQLERLAIVYFAGTQKLFCFAGSQIYEVGPEFEDLLNKAKMWTLRQTMKVAGSVHEIERPGTAMSGSNTRVSIGLISQGPSSKGLLVEVCEPTYMSTIQSHANMAILSEIMGPIYETLLATAKKAAIVASTGANLSTATESAVGELQTAAAYFELFAKL